MAYCPYCRAPLDKLPTRKAKCRTCGQFVFVKSTPSDPVRRLVTAEQAEDIERQWRAQYEVQHAQHRAAAKQAQERSRRNMLQAAQLMPGFRARLLVGPSASAPRECRQLDGAIVDVHDPLFEKLAPCSRDDCACCWVAVVPGWKSTTRGKA